MIGTNLHGVNLLSPDWHFRPGEYERSCRSAAECNIIAFCLEPSTERCAGFTGAVSKLFAALMFNTQRKVAPIPAYSALKHYVHKWYARLQLHSPGSALRESFGVISLRHQVIDSRSSLLAV